MLKLRFFLVFMLISSLCCSFAFAEGTGGKYTGDSTDNRSIGGIAFDPDIVWVKETDKLVKYEHQWKMDVAAFTSKATDSSAEWNPVILLGQTDKVQQLGTASFEIGSDDSVNDDTYTYYWHAIKKDADSIAIGQYTGDGTDNREITGVGFEPELVIVTSDTNSGFINDSTNGDSSPFLDNINPASNAIQDVDFSNDSFQIGSRDEVNEDAEECFYIAFKDEADHVEVGRYTGDGNDDRTIATSFQPYLVIVEANGNADAIICGDGLGANESIEFCDDDTNKDNTIQDLLAGGFEIGTDDDSNANGVTYMYVAIAESVGGAPTAERGTENAVFTNAVLTDCGGT